MFHIHIQTVIYIRWYYYTNLTHPFQILRDVRSDQSPEGLRGHPCRRRLDPAGEGGAPLHQLRGRRHAGTPRLQVQRPRRRGQAHPVDIHVQSEMPWEMDQAGDGGEVQERKAGLYLCVDVKVLV